MSFNREGRKLCPYCGASAVDMTVHGEDVERFVCTGSERHRWTERIQQAEPETPDGKPLIVLS